MNFCFYRTGRLTGRLLLGLLVLLASLAAHAQTPAWDGATPGSFSQPNGTYWITDVATDAQGNVLVTGHFTGQILLGSLRLTSAGSYDLFVAKYAPATDRWVWAQRGGGTSGDYGRALAVSGTSIYVTAATFNTRTNANAVTFGGASPATSPVSVAGASTSASHTDLLLVKYTDNGATASYVWSQVGGGTRFDGGAAVAVSGSSIYVVGTLVNSTANTAGAVFGGSGSTAGTLAVAGAGTTLSADLLLAKYIDNGATGTVAWAQVGGGSGPDYGNAVAISGQRIVAAGSSTPAATFGPVTISGPAGVVSSTLATLTDATLPLPTLAGVVAGSGGLTLYPNPAPGAATLTGAGPGQTVQVLDALGRVAATATTGADGTAALNGLAPGLYLVRVGTGSVRLTVE